MKTKISVLIIAALFCTLSYSQSTRTPADQPVDFSMVEQTQDLKYAFEGQYLLKEFVLSDTKPKKAGQVTKSALIGFGTGAGVGALLSTMFGLMLADEIALDTNSEPSYKGLGKVTLLGTGVGAVIGLGSGIVKGIKNNKARPYDSIHEEAVKNQYKKTHVIGDQIFPEVRLVAISHNL